MRASQDRFRAGMPHLDIFGLSEHYCLTNAGNLHWKWISKLTARRPSEWISEDGKRVYASFVYTALTYDRDVAVREDDEISVGCKPRSLKPPFFVTETTYHNSDGALIALAQMMSTLSTVEGRSNSRFAKSSLDFQVKPFGEEMLDETRARFRHLRSHDDSDLIQASQHLVNPSVDFNAANFMYFANFSQLFKRYECPALSAVAPLKFREIAYFGNVDPFEWTTIASRQENMNVMSSMTRSSDFKCIARSFSTSVRKPETQAMITKLQRAPETAAPVKRDAVA